MSEQLIGPFQVRAPTAGSGPGEWYEAVDTRSDKPVILRLVDPNEVPLPAGFDELGSEARNIRHANLARLVEAGRYEGKAYVAREVVSGRPLVEVVAEGSLDIEGAIRWCQQLAGAMYMVHGFDQLVGGLKPSAVVVTPENDAIITDILVPDTPIWEDGAGSAGRYLSPERRSGNTHGVSDDLFALGAVFYEIICGRPAFRAAPTASSRYPEEALTRLKPDWPTHLENIVLQLLSGPPPRGYAKALKPLMELRDLERALLSGPDVVARGPALSGGRPLRKIALAGLLLITTILVIAALIFL